MCTPVPPTGHWHEDYERGRPGWPVEALDIGCLSATATVLELGAGTGKLTRLLLGKFIRVTAVEPDEEMRALLARYAPRAEVVPGAAERIPLADSCVDAVFVAEAFHLFEGDRVVREIARVLEPGGLLALLWNVPAGPTTPSIAAAEELLLERSPPDLAYDPVDLNTRRYASGEWRVPFVRAPFGPFRTTRIPNPQTLDRDGMLAFFESMGWVGHLPEPERVPLLDRVRALLDAVEYHRVWETRVHWTSRVADDAS
jgi:SAM-dependent methyltransferase